MQTKGSVTKNTLFFRASKKYVRKFLSPVLQAPPSLKCNQFYTKGILIQWHLTIMFAVLLPWEPKYFYHHYLYKLTITRMQGIKKIVSKLLNPAFTHFF